MLRPRSAPRCRGIHGKNNIEGDDKGHEEEMALVLITDEVVCAHLFFWAGRRDETDLQATILYSRSFKFILRSAALTNTEELRGIVICRLLVTCLAFSPFW
jgi:hypothetical protein